MPRPEDKFHDLESAHVKLKAALDLVRWARAKSVYEVIPEEWFDAIEIALKRQADAASRAAYKLVRDGK